MPVLLKHVTEGIEASKHIRDLAVCHLLQECVQQPGLEADLRTLIISQVRGRVNDISGGPQPRMEYPRTLVSMRDRSPGAANPGRGCRREILDPFRVRENACPSPKSPASPQNLSVHLR